MATTSIRIAAKERLVALLQEALPAVQVCYAWPGEDARDECVYLGGVVGNVTVRDLRSGRKARDDTFTLTVRFYAGARGQSVVDADRRVEELYGALEDVLANNAQLALDTSDPTTKLDGILWAAQQDGLAEYAEPEWAEEGAVAEASAQVLVRTILN